MASRVLKSPVVIAKPSLVHVSTTPKRKAGVKRFRQVQSPRLYSPSVIEKPSAWKDIEKEYLNDYVISRGGVQHVNWKDCAKAMKLIFGKEITVKACLLYYKRQDSPKSNCVEQGIQTDISIGSYEAVQWKCIPVNLHAVEDHFDNLNLSTTESVPDIINMQSAAKPLDRHTFPSEEVLENTYSHSTENPSDSSTVFPLERSQENCIIRSLMVNIF